MWIEIFRTGDHTDKNGISRSYTYSDLDRMVKAYNPQWHEAPVVIGDIQDEDPAYAWVESLKREGNILFANLINITPEFLDILKKGLFQKRTTSFYPDLSLKHVSFLGPKPVSPIAVNQGFYKTNLREGDKAIKMEFSLKGSFGEVAARRLRLI